MFLFTQTRENSKRSLSFLRAPGRLDAAFPEDCPTLLSTLLDGSLHNFYFRRRPCAVLKFPFSASRVLAQSLLSHFAAQSNIYFPSKRATEIKQKPSRRLNYQAMIEGGDNKEEQKYEKISEETEARRRRKKSACLKKLRCYTIVFHNKPKQPLLHQLDCVMRMKENATKDFK